MARWLWLASLWPLLLPAADLTISIPRDGKTATPINWTADEIKATPVLWVKADPKRVDVTVVTPTGTLLGPLGGEFVDINRADPNSGNENEVFLAQRLGGPATLVSFRDRAAPGTYTLVLTGHGFSDPSLAVTVTRTDFASLLAAANENARNAPDLPPRPTVQLTVEGELFRTLTVGDQDIIFLKLDDAGRRIASAAVNGIWYRLREGSDQPLITFGPHPSKQTEGNAIRVPRGADGGFRYPFALTEPGRHQLDLTAEGTFADGGRFSTASVVTVFVLRRAAVATAIRQVRPAGSNSVRFLVDLDVILPGRYEARVGLDAMSGTIAPAAGSQTLAPGRRTLVIEGDAAFLAALEQNPAARLTLGVQWTPPSPDPAAPTGVSVRAKPIRARDFSIPAAAAGGLLTGGVRWKLEDSDHNGRPDRLRITVPVSLQGAGCEWSARLGLDKVPVVSEVRTISYLQSGPVDKRPGPIETDWDLSPFFPSGALPAEQAFVFRLLPAYCADGGYYAAEEVTPDDGSLLVARFVADLSHFELRPETPRHSGHLKLEPLDQDGDGKFDHLRATWALVTATGGRCVWNHNIAFDMESHGVGNVAMTRPGANSVTDEIDVTLSFSLQGQSRMRYVVGELRCGPNAAFSGEDLVAPPKHPPVIDQEFALPPGKFAAQNEFKPPAPVRPAVAIDWAPASPGEPPYANLARPTNRHGDMVRLAVKSGTAKVASVDGITAQLYRAGARGLAQPLVTGPAPYKDAVGRPFPMKRVGDTFETSFFQETAGLYQLDVTATGTLADGQPFTATHPVNLWNPAEDLLVTAFEPEGLGNRRRPRPDHH